MAVMKRDLIAVGHRCVFKGDDILRPKETAKPICYVLTFVSIHSRIDDQWTKVVRMLGCWSEGCKHLENAFKEQNAIDEYNPVAFCGRPFFSPTRPERLICIQGLDSCRLLHSCGISGLASREHSVGGSNPVSHRAEFHVGKDIKESQNITDKTLQLAVKPVKSHVQPRRLYALHAKTMENGQLANDQDARLP